MQITKYEVLHESPTYAIHEYTLDQEYGFHTFVTTGYRYLDKRARRELHTLGKSELVITNRLRVIVAAGRSTVTAVSGDKMLTIFDAIGRNSEDAVMLTESKLASDEEVAALRTKLAEKAAKSPH